MAFDFSQFAVGGAQRPDSFTGMDPRFLQSLAALFAAAPPNVQQALRVGSGYRSVERQRQLWEASDKTGHSVARPGHSQHNFGKAADLKYLAPAARQWAHQNAAQFGLNFPLGHEDWHIELAGARDGKAGASVAATAPAALGDLVAATPVATTAVAGTPEAPAFNILRASQEQKLAQAEEERAQQQRRAALFSPPQAPLATPPQPNVWRLYG